MSSAFFSAGILSNAVCDSEKKLDVTQYMKTAAGNCAVAGIMTTMLTSGPVFLSQRCRRTLQLRLFVPE